MSRTYVKGRISKDKRRGFKRSGWKSHCQCSYCCVDSRNKGWKKTRERNEIKTIMFEYNSTKSRLNKMQAMTLLIPMSMS